MPRITINQNLSAAADGSFAMFKTVDIAKELSEHYGKLVRQMQLFQVRSVEVRVRNPNTLAQDDHLSVAGNIQWFSPTANRKRAVINAFNAVQRLRRQHGLIEKGYDFRLGLGPDDVWGEVPMQAWIRDEGEELYLFSNSSSDRNSVFSVWNAQQMQEQLPVDPDLNGFGTPYDTPGVGEGDLDFHEGEGGDAGFYQEGHASQDPDTAPFIVALGGAYDNLGSTDHGFATNAEKLFINSQVMCGLMGIYFDTTIPDDSELQTQDVGVEVVIDVRSWSPILQKKKRGKNRGRK